MAASPAAIGRRELAGWAAAMLLLAVVRLALVGGPQFMNDSYQYLSVVENLRRHHAVATSIVHFDVERGSGRIPAPETTFPPGYPLLAWAVTVAGLRPEWAALAVSLASALAVLPLLAAAGAALGLPCGPTRLALGAWVGSAQASLYAVTLYSETTFTAVSLLALVLLLREEGEAERGPGWRVPLAGVMTGLASWIRYAGLFYVVALHGHALARAARRRPGSSRWLVALAACDVLVGAILLRNALLAGTWMGGNAPRGRRGAAEVAHRLAAGVYELAVGSIQDRPPRAILLCAALLAAGVLVAGAAGVAALRAQPGHGPGRPRTVLLSYGAAYVAGMCYAGVTSDISLGARMFVPLVPVVALLAAGAVPPGGVARAGTALAAAGYLGANALSLTQPPRLAEHRWIAQAFELATPAGEPLSRWVETTLPARAVLLAVDGQGTGYLLGRSTVSAVGREYSPVSWSEEETRATMARFGADWLIVYPDVVESGGVDQLDSELFRRLAARRLPPWLELAAENPRVLVFRRR
jgi:hypothetical protein